MAKVGEESFISKASPKASIVKRPDHETRYTSSSMPMTFRMDRNSPRLPIDKYHLAKASPGYSRALKRESSFLRRRKMIVCPSLQAYGGQLRGGYESWDTISFHNLD